MGERSYAALAQHHVVISLGENVFGGHEKFIQSGGHAALEEHGLFGAAGAFEQRKILHVARADLDDVGVLFDEVERFVVNRFSNDAESISSAHFRKDLEAFFAETLEAVRGSAGLISAAAEEPRAGFLGALGDSQALLFGFDGAGTGNESNVLAAYNDVSRGRGDSKDAVFFFGVAADELVRLADGDAFANAGHGFEDAEINGAFVAGDSDGRANRSGDGVRLEAQAFNALADGAYLFFSSVRLHNDKHEGFPRVASKD